MAGERGIFIAFEGIDGSGKSTQARLLEDRIRRSGLEVYLTFEPTKRPVGALLRKVLTGDLVMDEETIAALFLADRLDHLHNAEDGLIGKIATGTQVITDRYYFSSYAYHSMFVPMEWVIRINARAAEALRPDIVFFLDIDPKQSQERMAKARDSFEHYEKVELLEKVRTNYLKAFNRVKSDENVIIIDGNRPMESIASEIWEFTAPLLKSKTA